jgi:hypothetical protein
MSNEIQTRQTNAVTLKGVVDRVNMVHEILSKIMKDGTHYGVVKGCGPKKVLLKPGADLLAMTFRLAPEYRVDRRQLGGEHVEYEVTCVMFGPDGAKIGEGVGSASTMESKYRYRWNDGVKVENPDIADVYNTVLKMAKKRAHIDATLTCTGASDMFTQDLIDDEGEEKTAPKPFTAPKVKTDALTVAGLIESVEVRDGEKNGKPWKKYGIHIGGMVVGTFDTKIGESAVTMNANATGAAITYTSDGKYNTAVSIAEHVKA